MTREDYPLELEAAVTAPNENDRGEFRDFFEASYRRIGYFGDKRFFRKFEAAEGVISLREKLSRGLAAAALVRGTRISMVGTAVDTVTYGPRLLNMTRLFGACPELSKAHWISIGEQYDRVQLAALNAGYFREGNPNRIEEILGSANVDQNYKIYYDPNLLPVILRKHEPDGIAYPQQVWVSEDNLPEEHPSV